MAKSEVIKKLPSPFDALAQSTPDEGIEFWFARDIQEPLGYMRWKNFLTTIQRAIESCKTTDCDPADHFRGVTKMVGLENFSAGYNRCFSPIVQIHFPRGAAFKRNRRDLAITPRQFHYLFLRRRFTHIRPEGENFKSRMVVKRLYNDATNGGIADFNNPLRALQLPLNGAIGDDGFTAR